ncbi:MAG: hypothetical protein NUV46_04070 [Nanoarchaeota archaeon]|nr:hypothetical protein [Nanoarchaeota archaeon]
MEFYFVLGGILLLFFVLLGIKEFFSEKFKKKFCVICASVTLTWIILLALNLYGLFDDKILLGILMGHTSLGLFYIFESNASEKVKVFRLPLLLTFISIIYFILSGFEKISFFILIGLWFIFSVIFIFSNKKSKSFVNKLIECCRNW